MKHARFDEEVALAVKQWRDWAASAGDGSPKGPRVTVFDGMMTVRVARRPFRHKGKWCVRWAGTAELINPTHDENGDIIFEVRWS